FPPGVALARVASLPPRDACALRRLPLPARPVPRLRPSRVPWPLSSRAEEPAFPPGVALARVASLPPRDACALRRLPLPARPVPRLRPSRAPWLPAPRAGAPPCPRGAALLRAASHPQLDASPRLPRA